MTSAATPATGSRPRAADDVAKPSSGGRLAAAARLLDRPLTSYYLLLGVSGILVGLGLVMVLSASSVLSYRTYGSSYTLFNRQADRLDRRDGTSWRGTGTTAAAAPWRIRSGRGGARRGWGEAGARP